MSRRAGYPELLTSNRLELVRTLAAGQNFRPLFRDQDRVFEVSR